MNSERFFVDPIRARAHCLCLLHCRKRMAEHEIPIIDMAALNSTGQPDAGVVASLAEACRHVGFFYVKNHGISEGLIGKLFDVSKRFFAKSREEKMKNHISKSTCHRGYGPLLEEATDETSGMSDLKETFDTGVDIPLSECDCPLHGPNQFPEDDPEMAEVMLQYFAEARELAGRLMRAFAADLELPLDFFVDKTDRPMANLRLIHYPPPQPGSIGCGTHTDYGCVTILAQDDVGGLFVQRRDGSWIDAVPVPGTLVVNLGDMMARWTNDAYKATPHRVASKQARDRYSVPFFFDPNFHAQIECVPSCRPRDGSLPKYAPVMAGEHELSRFDATFAYRKQELP